MDWEYRASFQVDRELLTKQNFCLLFKGLDTYADIFLNGSKILATNNMFRTWRIDGQPLRKEGANELKICFHSLVKIDLPNLAAPGYSLPAGMDNFQSKRKIKLLWDTYWQRAATVSQMMMNAIK